MLTLEVRNQQPKQEKQLQIPNAVCCMLVLEVLYTLLTITININ